MPIPAASADTTALLALARVAGGGPAARLLARALRHVLPFVGRVVARGLAGAGVARRAAVVLPGLGDAVALLARRLRVRGLRMGALCRAQREDAGDGGVDQRGAGGHVRSRERPTSRESYPKGSRA